MLQVQQEGPSSHAPPRLDKGDDDAKSVASTANSVSKLKKEFKT
jgi:hypothetical protein